MNWKEQVTHDLREPFEHGMGVAFGIFGMSGLGTCTYEASIPSRCTLSGANHSASYFYREPNRSSYP